MSKKARLASRAAREAVEGPRTRPETLGCLYFGTEDWGDGLARNFEERRGRCFELAAAAVLFGDLVEHGDALLVHGSIHGPEEAMQRISHAWVEFGSDGRRCVWEPITGSVYERDRFYHWAGADAERSYSRVTAQLMAARTGNYGAWHPLRWPSNPPEEEV